MSFRQRAYAFLWQEPVLSMGLTQLLLILQLANNITHPKMLDAASNTAIASTAPTLPSLVPLHAPVLAPKPNRPVRQSKAADAWSYLQRIESIVIEPIDGSTIDETMYTIKLFFHRNQNRIPTNSPHGTISTLQRKSSCDDSPPDVEILHTFTEYQAFRQDVKAVVRQYHPVYCELCDSFAVQMFTTLAQPKLLTATLDRSRTKRAKKMCVFMETVLLALREKRMQCIAVCKGQNELPLLLHHFLSGKDTTAASSAQVSILE